MFRLRVTRDCQPRTKKGQPPQSTTGAASSELDPERRRAGRSAASGQARSSRPWRTQRRGWSGSRLTQNRRVMSTSSGLGPSSAASGSTRLERHAALGASARARPGGSPGAWDTCRSACRHGRRRAARRAPAPGIVAGSATNRSRQLGLQNQYVVPACSALPPSASPGRHVHAADRIDHGHGLQTSAVSVLVRGVSVIVAHQWHLCP